MVEDPITPARRRFPRLILMIIAVDTVLVAILIFWLATRDGTPPAGSAPAGAEPAPSAPGPKAVE